MSRLQPITRDRSGYLSNDTIAALTTSVGGAIAIVRMSGPQSFDALASLTKDSASVTIEPRKLYRARLVDPTAAGIDREIDDALYVRFIAPESFTGENVVELHLHGGGYIASRVLELLYRLGIRQALPGEFSYRAVRNGKMTLSQATAVADLIQASNAGAVSLALEKLSGTQHRMIAELAKSLRRLAVLGEIGIDFADQDVDEVSLPQLKKNTLPLLETLVRLHQSYRRGALIQDGIRVAFIGLPNAGKSSFFNALLGEDRSIVSEVPGTTRDIVREKMTLQGTHHTVTLRLEDTAGLRSTENIVEKMGIDRTQRAAKEADLLLFLVDTNTSLEPALEQWKALDKPVSKTLGIVTKSDLINSSLLEKIDTDCAAFGITQWVTTSATTGHGISAAVDAITSFCSQWVERTPGEVVLTRLDQAQSVEETIQHLRRAQSAEEIDLFAADVRQALYSLGLLIGETLPNDILGQIFSEFCIGK